MISSLVIFMSFPEDISSFYQSPENALYRLKNRPLIFRKNCCIFLSAMDSCPDMFRMLCPFLFADSDYK